MVPAHVYLSRSLYRPQYHHYRFMCVRTGLRAYRNEHEQCLLPKLVLCPERTGIDRNNAEIANIYRKVRFAGDASKIHFWMNRTLSTSREPSPGKMTFLIRVNSREQKRERDEGRKSKREQTSMEKGYTAEVGTRATGRSCSVARTKPNEAPIHNDSRPARASATSLLLYLLAMRAARRRVNFIHQRNSRLSNLSAAAITAAGSTGISIPGTKGIQRRVLFFSPTLLFLFRQPSLCVLLSRNSGAPTASPWQQLYRDDTARNCVRAASFLTSVVHHRARSILSWGGWAAERTN